MFNWVGNEKKGFITSGLKFEIKNNNFHYKLLNKQTKTMDVIHLNSFYMNVIHMYLKESALYQTSETDDKLTN